MYKIFSIGHGNDNTDSFINRLKRWNIDCLVDLRSQPYSKYVPHFNRENLSDTIKKAKIDYLYFGDKLGGRPPEGFEKYRITPRFRENVDLLLSQVEGRFAALMCTEFDESKCHRRFIVEEIIKKGIDVIIIDKKGNAGKHLPNVAPKSKLQKSRLDSQNQSTLAGFCSEDDLE